MEKTIQYFYYCIMILELNAWIELISRENKRNILDDPYYKNYNRFTPVSHHDILSFYDWQKLTS